MNDLNEQLRADPLAECVVLFGQAHLAAVSSLLVSLLRDYRLYRATDAEGAHLFNQISAQDFSCLAARLSAHYWIDFYSETPPLFRPRFLFVPAANAHLEVKLYFDLAAFPHPPPVADLLSSLQRFAILLCTEEWSLHHAINSEWKSGDFSAATLIYHHPESSPSDRNA